MPPPLKPIIVARDFSDAMQALMLPQDQLSDLIRFSLRAAGQVVYDTWMGLAAKRLRSSRNQYQEGLELVEVSDSEVHVVLRGVLANMIENGTPAYDMKIGFSKSGKVKFNKKGQWYLTVPFRWGTPGSLVDNFYNIMPVEVYNIIRQTVGKKTQSGGTSTPATPLRSSQLPGQLGIPRTRAAFSDLETKSTFPAYRHKAPIYAGMQKQTKTYQGSSQSQYVSFRRVGANSDPNAFIHRGIQQYNLADEAIQNADIDQVFDNSIQTWINANT